MVQSGRRRRIIRTTCIKPWNKSTLQEPTMEITKEKGEYSDEEILTKAEENGSEFIESRRKELEGLIKNGKLTVTQISKVPKDQRIF